MSGIGLAYFPSVKASSIALGTVYTHAISLAVLGPVFGDTYSRAQAANTKEEFLKSKEAAGAAAAWGTSLAGSVIQTYGVGAILVSSGTMSTKGAAAIGGLVFLATSAPSILSQIFTEKRPTDTVAVGVLARLFETVGLSMLINWNGAQTSPFD